nr:nucleoside-diphosphate sugar epimerase/dehydratase [Ignatzschineria cameli]
MAFIVRIGWDDTWLHLNDYEWLFIVAPIISLPIFIMMGMYRAVIRYVGKEALITIAKAVTLAALLLSVVIYWYDDAPKVVPRSLIFNYWWISLLVIGGLRLFIRHYFLGDWLDIFKHPFGGHHKGRARVLVYGAGNAGKQLVSALRSGSHIEPIAFIDDDPHIRSGNIDGLKVYAPNQVEMAINQTKATELLLAIPSASRSRRQEIITSLSQFPIRVRTIPGFIDLAKGKVKVQDLQEIDIADLLGRDPVEPHRDLFDFCIKNQVVMVTGAGGSIGSELCRQILLSGAKQLILFENSEYNLYKITRELQEEIKKEQLDIQFTPLLGSIQDRDRLYNVMTKFNVNTIYHAAAYKHVPIVENNITQGVLNNVLGTYYTAEAAIKARVNNFVLISTDKAVRPTNVMGATKRLAEMVLQSFSKERAITFLGDSDPTQNKTRITMVRFGNVLGSSGSVIPLFRKQIQEGNNVTVTHPDITRYFMTIPEAAELVIQAGSMGLGGDVFVLDMGQPVRILDLATKMIQLSGLTIRNKENPNGDIAIQFTGLRAGEKLYEELLIGDNVTGTEHPMIMRAHEDWLPWSEMKTLLEKLKTAADHNDYPTIRALLLQYVSGYQPQCEIVDLLYLDR